MKSMSKRMLRVTILMLLAIAALPAYAVLDEDTPVPSRRKKKAAT